MNKEKTYITLWIVSLVMPLLVMLFMYTGLNLYVVLASFAFKFILGIIGITCATKNWQAFKEEKRAQRKPLVPFYIIAVLVIQIVFLTLLSVVLSDSEAVATGSGYALMIAVWVAALLAGTYAWEVEFLKVVENTGVRTAFAISTPLLLFTAETIVVIGAMAL